MHASRRGRLRYRVDTLLARRRAGPLIWLGAATALLTVVGALVFWLLGVDWDNRSGPAESLWQAFVIAIARLISCAPGTYRYHDLRMHVGERNMVLLGVVTAEGTHLNPPGDTEFELTSTDRLVILGRFGLR